MITLTVNGKPREAEGPVNLKRYLVDIGITQTAIAVAHNGTVIPEAKSSPSRWKTATRWK